MTTILAILLACLAPSYAATPDAGTADKTTLDLVQYFLKVDTAEANPKLIDPFLKIDPETLPKKLRKKTMGKQFELKTLLKLHDTKKMGVLIQKKDDCDPNAMIHPLSQADTYLGFGNEEINEEELEYVMKKTKCNEIDLGCRFSLLIFFEKKKPRRLEFLAADPIMAIVAESRGKGGSTHFFGMGVTCLQ